MIKKETEYLPMRGDNKVEQTYFDKENQNWFIRYVPEYYLEVTKYYITLFGYRIKLWTRRKDVK